MATTKQKEAARKNLEKARAARSRAAGGSKRSSSNGSARASSNGSKRSSGGGGMSTAEKNDLPTKVFAFPKQRKEPLNDAKHVRNAVARFDQVEGVSDGQRAKAWKRIKKAAKKYDVDIEADGWRELVSPGTKKKGKGGKKNAKAKSTSGKKNGKKRSSAKSKKKS